MEDRLLMNLVSIPMSLALVCAMVIPSPAGESVATQQKSASEARPSAYPTFEPFVASRMFKEAYGNIDKVDLNEVLAQIPGAKSEVDKIPPTAREGGATARLTPPVSEWERLVLSYVPIVMMKAKPLWDAQTWSSNQVELATAAAGIVKNLAGAPKLAFAKGEDVKNRASLEQLVNWFNVTAAKPECYAAMIFTMDDGPFAGIPYPTEQSLAAAATLRIDDATELRLCKVDRRNEPWVLQGVHQGHVLWSRVVSAAPDESVREVSFTDRSPLRVGPYGWEVYLRVEWSQGVRTAYVYLDSKGTLLFYYLSW